MIILGILGYLEKKIYWEKIYAVENNNYTQESFLNNLAAIISTSAHSDEIQNSNVKL